MTYVYKNLSIVKSFNDTSNTLSNIYYPTTNLYIIKSINIVGVFDNCMT